MICVLFQWDGFIYPSVDIVSRHSSEVIASVILIARELSLTLWKLPLQQQQLLAHLLTMMIVVTAHTLKKIGQEENVYTSSNAVANLDNDRSLTQVGNKNSLFAAQGQSCGAKRSVRASSRSKSTIQQHRTRTSRPMVVTKLVPSQWMLHCLLAVFLDNVVGSPERNVKEATGFDLAQFFKRFRLERCVSRGRGTLHGAEDNKKREPKPDGIDRGQSRLQASSQNSDGLVPQISGYNAWRRSRTTTGHRTQTLSLGTGSQTLSYQDYTVGWICALSIEMAAAKAMLDEVHADLPARRSDDNTYILGRIGSHNIVITCLPSGRYGAISAATVATRMLLTFQSIRFGLMVGIGGGVPIQDIRLGDVVIGNPTGHSGGVLQCDVDFERTSTLDKPPGVLLKALSRIQAHHIGNLTDYFVRNMSMSIQVHLAPAINATSAI
ncbi:hypothetical protein BDW59DRAFT_165545 [Aspergillus cavernicola]|uniref:Nucleoside phosphorylase domain-containing protein n=1 Tax=Aspergillus cavernicola TaxID=176166 RepID=A0ABR4HRT9_9EURO